MNGSEKLSPELRAVYESTYAPGSVEVEEWEYLHHLSKKSAELGKDILEIGSYSGCSTAAFAYYLSKTESKQRVVSVDIDRNEAFWPNMDGVALRSYIEPFDGASLDYVPKRDFSIVFIDADHYFQQVYHDVAYHSNHVAVGGFFLGHDYLPPAYDVMKVVDDFFRDNSAFAKVEPPKKYAYPHKQFKPCNSLDNVWAYQRVK